MKKTKLKQNYVQEELASKKPYEKYIFKKRPLKGPPETGSPEIV
jgi:hypothetical protein